MGAGNSVTCVVHDRVATITIDRVEAMNAIDESVLDGLAAAVEQVRGDDDVVGVVVCSEGDKAFCIGLDIGLLGKAFDDHDYFEDVVHRYKDVLIGIESLPVPVIAVVDGLTRAGGFELLLACDLAIVSDDARIGDTHAAFGLLPGGGAAVRAPRKLGHQRAAELLLTDRWLSGAEAVEAGLAVRSVPRQQLDAAVGEVTTRLRKLPRAALAATKAAMVETRELPHREALEEELRRFRSYLDGEPLHREGYDSFVEKRKPSWLD